MPERHIEYRVVGGDGSVFGAGVVWDHSHFFEGWRERYEENHPDLAPFRVQSRVVTIGDWKDET